MLVGGLILLVVAQFIDIMLSPYQVAESIAFDAYMTYHRERLQLPEGLETVGQLRKYDIIDNEDHYAIQYRDGVNSGMPTIYAKVDKLTGERYV